MFPQVWALRRQRVSLLGFTLKSQLWRTKSVFMKKGNGNWFDRYSHPSKLEAKAMTSSSQHQTQRLLCRPCAVPILCRCSATLKHSRLAIPSFRHLLLLRRMTAGKFGGFVVLLHTFLLTHSAVVKAFGANLKNEVAKVSKAAFHTARVVVFFLRLRTWSFVCMAAAQPAPPKQQMLAKGFPTARKKTAAVY